MMPRLMEHRGIKEELKGCDPMCWVAEMNAAKAWVEERGEYQKQIIDNFVNSVYVYDERLVMTNNDKDGTETISFDAVHQAFDSDLSRDASLQILHFDAGFLC